MMLIECYRNIKKICRGYSCRTVNVEMMSRKSLKSFVDANLILENFSVTKTLSTPNCAVKNTFSSLFFGPRP